jgi:hypothetical protein
MTTKQYKSAQEAKPLYSVVEERLAKTKRYWTEDLRRPLADCKEGRTDSFLSEKIAP